MPTLMMSIYFGFPDCYQNLIMVLILWLQNHAKNALDLKFCKISTNLEIRWLERCKILVCVGRAWLWLVLIHLVDRWRLSRPRVTYCDTLGFLAYTNSSNIYRVFHTLSSYRVFHVYLCHKQFSCSQLLCFEVNQSQSPKICKI